MNGLKKLLKENYNISENLISFFEKINEDIREQYIEIDKITQINQYKVLSAMQKNKLSERHFIGTTGYGYGDSGRETLDRIYADVFGTEDALVRHNFISGTHALSTTLFGLLRSGDTLLSVTGHPYDTLKKVIGISGQVGQGTLKEFGINYKKVDLTQDGKVDFVGLEKAINDNVRVATIQRSCGYDWRESVSIDEIKKIIKFIKDLNPNIICMVDNCYGEFVEELEPSNVGADVCVGSLIKNPGGGLAQTGGYVVGKSEYIEKIAYRLTAPGLGRECGATFDFNRNMIQGLFLAPHVVGESLKGAVFAAKLFEKLGFEVSPLSTSKRTDIVQAIKFKDKEKLIAFCQGVQKASPVDSFVRPEPWNMPGYVSEVIMAAGTFVQGASIELSADAPIKDPYIGYIQGGLTADHVKLGVLIALQEMANKGLVSL